MKFVATMTADVDVKDEAAAAKAKKDLESFLNSILVKASLEARGTKISNAKIDIKRKT